MKKNKGYIGYKVLRFILKPFFKLYYGPKILNKAYLNIDGPVIIAGNHKHAYDQCPTIISSKRVVHYMSKKEYFDAEASLFGKPNKFSCWITKIIVKSIGCIPVDRSIKDEDAKQAAVEVLNDGGAIGIFPEGTRNKTEDFLLPFKFGTVSLAQKTSATIIPFGVTGDYKFRSKNLIVRFGEPFKVDDMTLEEANQKLYEVIKGLMEENLKTEKD